MVRSVGRELRTDPRGTERGQSTKELRTGEGSYPGNERWKSGGREGLKVVIQTGGAPRRYIRCDGEVASSRLSTAPNEISSCVLPKYATTPRKRARLLLPQCVKG